MADKEWAHANLLDVFGDPIARATLVLANQQSVSVTDLADRLDVSEQTVYRRVNELVDLDLLKEHQRIGQKGNQHKEYVTVFDEVTFAVDDDGYTVDVQVQQHLGDGFGSLWSDLESTDRDVDTGRSNQQDMTGGDPA